MMKNTILNRRHALGAFVVSTLALFDNKQAQASDKPTTYAEVGKAAPSFDIAKIGGGRFNNRSLRGKTTIVEFWGLWCPDCLADGANTAQLANRVRRERNINFIGIHTRGRYGRWGSVENYFQEKGYSYPVAIDDNSAVYNAFKLAWVPTYLIIDRNGIIRDFTTDLGSYDGIGVDGLLARARAISTPRR